MGFEFMTLKGNRMELMHEDNFDAKSRCVALKMERLSEVYHGEDEGRREKGLEMEEGFFSLKGPIE